MADRRCPFCGELVPSNSLTCPKCYKKIPADYQPEPVQPQQAKGTNRKFALILGAVLGLFGLLGMGQLYSGRYKRGATFLVVGLIFFIPAIILTFIIPFISWILAVPLFVIYAILYLAALADLVIDATFLGMVRRSRQSPAPELHEDRRCHLREMDRVHPVPDACRIPGTQR